jgi:hypothetical protein
MYLYLFEDVSEDAFQLLSFISVFSLRYYDDGGFDDHFGDPDAEHDAGDPDYDRGGAGGRGRGMRKGNRWRDDYGGEYSDTDSDSKIKRDDYGAEYRDGDSDSKIKRDEYGEEYRDGESDSKIKRDEYGAEYSDGESDSKIKRDEYGAEYSDGDSDSKIKR